MFEILEYSNKIKELYIGKDTINKIIEAYKKSIIENDNTNHAPWLSLIIITHSITMKKYIFILFLPCFCLLSYGQITIEGQVVTKQDCQ